MSQQSISSLVEKRAYELFLERGGKHGYHMEDWVRAEKEVMAGTAAPQAKPAAKAGKKK